MLCVVQATDYYVSHAPRIEKLHDFVMEKMLRGGRQRDEVRLWMILNIRIHTHVHACTYSCTKSVTVASCHLNVTLWIVLEYLTTPVVRDRFNQHHEVVVYFEKRRRFYCVCSKASFFLVRCLLSCAVTYRSLIWGKYMQNIIYQVSHHSLLHEIDLLQCIVAFVLQKMCRACMLHSLLIIQALRWLAEIATQ